MLRRSFILTAPLALAACSGRWTTDYASGQTADVTRNWRVRDVIVDVPDNLSVSDENRLAPNADIVWHGDPAGDRRAQVATIMRDGVSRATSELSGRQLVTFSVTMQEFHAVTPAAVARAPSAVHNISYVLQVFDAETIQPVTEPELITADLPANTQAAAILAAQQGQSQKARIVNHIDRVTRSWLGIGEDLRGSFTSLGR